MRRARPTNCTASSGLILSTGACVASLTSCRSLLSNSYCGVEMFSLFNITAPSTIGICQTAGAASRCLSFATRSRPYRGKARQVLPYRLLCGFDIRRLNRRSSSNLQFSHFAPELNLNIAVLQCPDDLPVAFLGARNTDRAENLQPTPYGKWPARSRSR